MPLFPAVIQLSSLDGSNGFRINGETAYDRAGWDLSAGDINNDGFIDLIIGAPTANTNGPSYGAAYVVFGKASGFGVTLELSNLDGNNGFRLNGEVGYTGLGRSVASAGDVNGDGFADIVLGAS